MKRTKELPTAQVCHICILQNLQKCKIRAQENKAVSAEWNDHEKRTVHYILYAEIIICTVTHDWSRIHQIDNNEGALS